MFSVVVILLLFGGQLDAQDTQSPIRIDSLVIDGDGDTCPMDDQLGRAVDKHAETVFAMMKGLSPKHPASSCVDVFNKHSSGYYWIQGKQDGPIAQVYCDMERTCSCNGTGGWMRVANLDMTNPNQQCPSGFRYVTSPRRSCGRIGWGCVSTTFPVHGVEYSRVCGKVIGYQDRSPDAFSPYSFDQTLTIDDAYFEGASLTHSSSPRVHIWTFAGVFAEQFGGFGPRVLANACPCTYPDIPFETNGGRVPPFIGQDYFCESGNRGTIEFRFFPEDPLWDGQGCGADSTCCDHPLYFCKQLPQPTTDDIELRLCGNQPINDEDTPLEIVELYVQ